MKSIFLKAAIVSAALSGMFVFTGCSGGSEGVVVKTTQESNSSAENKKQSKPPQSDKSDGETLSDIPSKVSPEQRQEFLEIINAARAETQDCGSEGTFDPAPALKWNNRLDNAAYEHSNDLAQTNTFSHSGSGTSSDITAVEEKLDRGSKFFERIKHYGYTNYHAVGENIAGGYTSAQEAVDAWLQSDHHCANLMNSRYTVVGMALVIKEGSEYGYYWSQEFGDR